MREIKFKAKRLDNGKWAYGYGVIIADDFCVLDKRDELQIQRPYTFRNNTHWFELCGIMCDTNTLSQFTGLHDKNGKEIYEGDIVRKKEIGGYGYEYVGVVRYYEEDCRYAIDITATNEFSTRALFTVGESVINDGYCTIKYTTEYEILGNVYDNPELLNDKNK